MEESKVIYVYLTYQDIVDNKHLQYDDKYHIVAALNPRWNALRHKPTGFNPNEICLAMGILDNSVVGAIILFLLRLELDNKETLIQGGTYLYSEPFVRKEAVGGELFFYSTKSCPAGAFAGGISQNAIPMYKALRFSLFEIPRYICLIHSRSVVEKVLKRKNLLTMAISAFTDGCLKLLRNVNLNRKSKLKIFSLVKLDGISDEILDMVSSDNHRFKEVHDKAWFDWNLKYSFNPGPNNKKEIYHILRDKDVVGFFLMKYEFFPEASSNGYKNVLLSTLMEWEIKDTSVLSEQDIKMLAIKSAEKQCDAIQIATFDNNIANELKKLGMRRVGNASVAALIREGTLKKELKDVKNWRIRLAAGDTLID